MTTVPANSVFLRQPIDRSFRRYVMAFLVTVALCGVPFLANYVVLVNARETMPLAEIAQRQQADNGIYFSGVNSSERNYKLELVRVLRPDIIAFGSSRSHQFRKQAFTASFVCVCGVAKSPADLELMADALLSFHTPKTVLITLDWWWFVQGYSKDEGLGPIPASASVVSVNSSKLARPWQWVWDGSITPSDYVALLAGTESLNDLTARPAYGIQAIKRSLGMRMDGSLLKGAHVAGLYTDSQDRISYDLDRIDRGVAPWPHGALNEEMFAKVENLRRKLQGAGSKVVLVMPPFPSMITDRLANHSLYSVVDRIRARIRSLPGEVFDFHDARSVGSPDCEFLDGRHGGDVTYLRMVREIVRRNPASAVAAHADIAGLDRDIERFAGRALARYEPELDRFAETDFLNLGCKK